MSGTVPPPRETGIGPDNPGREDGPTLLMNIFTVYPVRTPDDLVGVSSLGACRFVVTTDEGGPVKDYGWPYANQVACGKTLYGATDGTTSEAVSEEAVDRLVDGLDQEEPTFLINVAVDGQGLDTCTAWILPSGRIQRPHKDCDGEFEMTASNAPE